MNKHTTFLLRTIIIILLTLPVCTSIKAQTSSFNFSAAPTTVTGWINVSGDPAVAVRSGTDPATGISITSIATGNWHPYDVSAYDGLGAANGTFFPAPVMLNHWFQYDGSLSNYNPASPQLRLSGLNRYAQYTLRMAGSSTSGLNSNPTRYTVTGNTTYAYADINSHNNTADGAVFNNVYPDSIGAITIYINTLSTTDVADISGLQISMAVKPLGYGSGLTRTRDSVILGGLINARTYPSGFRLNFIDTINTAYNGRFQNDASGFFATAQVLHPGLDGQTSALYLSPGYFRLNDQSFVYSGSISSGSADITAFGNSVSGGNRVTISCNDMTGGSVLEANPKEISLRATKIRLTQLLNNPSGDSILSTDNAGNLQLRSLSSFASAGRWKLTGTTNYDSADNIGIGTSNTQGFKLAVNGGVLAKIVKVTPNGWADYVFDSTYHLPALEEVDKYIRANKHLQDITSASEVTTQGLDLGNNQAAMLKKIEELTLYMIRQDKALKKANKQLSALIKEVNALKAVHK